MSLAQGPLSGRNILIAEDCEAQGRVYVEFLQRAGSNVCLDSDGLQALDEFKNAIEPFDAVVLDFMMPRFDGIVATIALREAGYLEPIIGVTAHRTRQLEQAWREAGCDVCIEKPLTYESLIGEIAARVSDSPLTGVLNEDDFEEIISYLNS